MTHTYDIKNLLLESNELYLITDSSEMEKEVLNEVNVLAYKNRASFLCKKINRRQFLGEENLMLIKSKKSFQRTLK